MTLADSRGDDSGALRRAVESTHEVRLGRRTVVKTFSVRHGDEAEREWANLVLLDRWAPGSAPRPVFREVADGTVRIAMGRVPGVPLAGAPLTGARLRAALDALVRMRTAVPAAVLGTLPPRRAGPVEMAERLRAALATTSYAGDAVVGQALVAARRWLEDEEPVAPATPEDLMLTHGDGNAANLVWDGSTCRVVDHEDGGVGDLPYEVADLVEHVTVALPGLIAEDELGPHLDRLGLRTGAAADRFAQRRALLATFWLVMLLPGNRGHHRNPTGSDHAQAVRLLGHLAALG
ncbi:phosphotransferase family protein [Nocardioides sp. AX2bis]|uniref:phosphotransferase family protein n=1 Tax=Nocardioides sp. AX2bis TaxID=2653157 RepID=UPI0012F34880|nr:phosphotransferase [Nocardioides sp. AX2bis]VXB53644.1 Phosphotransferase enzyme family protein [Nocardioides sp. AX2bis]